MAKKKTLAYDIETYLDSTTIVFKVRRTSKYIVFVHSDVLPFDKEKLFINKSITIYPMNKLGMFLQSYDLYLVGYNNLSFDDQVMGYILIDLQCEDDVLANKVYKFAQKIISNQNSKDNKVKFSRNYWSRDLNKYFKSLDLLKVNHYDNMARRTSLKKLEFSYRSSSIEDLPFDHTTSVTTYAKLKQVIRYCCKDTLETEKCLEVSTDRIKFRLEINKEKKETDKYFDCLNWSDVKIGEYENLMSYCSLSGHDPKSVKSHREKYTNKIISYNDNIPRYINFKSPQLKDFLERFKSLRLGVNEHFSEHVIYKGVNYNIAQGGIHSKDPARVLKPEDDEVLCELDVGGQYPSFLIKSGRYPKHLGPAWNTNAKNKYLERINKWKPLAKKEGKGSYADTKQLGIKLALNGGLYGKLKDVYSWQYDPEIAVAVVLCCQLEIMMLVEMMDEIGVTVYSANTDGILCKYKKSMQPLVDKTMKEWEKLTNSTEVGQLEQTDYSLFVQTSVNSYIAVKTGGGIKRKGIFINYDDICNDNYHKDSSALVIADALAAYFIHETPVEDTINAENNIHQFLYGAPKTRAFRWVVTTRDGKGVMKSTFRDERFIRYYAGGNQTISKMFLRDDPKTSTKKRPRLVEGITALQAKTPVTLAMKFTSDKIDDFDKDGNITYKIDKKTGKAKVRFPGLDRQWYVDKCNEWINKIEQGTVYITK